MTLASDMASLVVAETLGVSSSTALWTIRATYGYGPDVDAALVAARDHQHSIDNGLVLAAAQHATLAGTLSKAKEQAAALHSTLTAVKTAATALEMDNDTAGDDALSALANFSAAINAAAGSLVGVSALTFATYRDEV